MDYNIDIINMLVRFVLNILASSIITYVVYQRIHRKRAYDFSFMILSTVIFFLCYFLSGVELQIGLALGLFAIFGIIRYRTDAVPIREMTYLFLVISLSVINALIDLQTQWEAVLIVNSIFILLPLIIERLKGDSKDQFVVMYDKIELVGKNKRKELIDDLEERLNVKIIDVKIEKIELAPSKVKLIVVIDN